MSEEEALLTRARENLRAARILILEELPSIAASRAYYALLFIAEALLLSRGLAFSSHLADHNAAVNIRCQGCYQPANGLELSGFRDKPPALAVG